MSYLDRVQQATQMSRRGFVATTAAATAALAATSLAGCSTNKVEKTEEAAVTTGSDGRDIINGEWKAAACWHNCGGRCMNKVMVKDGAVIRQKTDDTHEDSFDYPQQRGCVRGKAQQQQCFGADRLKYPIKRKTWSPENPNGEMRGKDEWERISWDEAISYIGDQFKTIKEKYGNQAFLLGSYGSRLAFAPLLAWGGHTSTADTTSHGAYLLNTADTIGIPRTDAGVCNDRTDMLNADTIVFYASNPAWSAAGTPSYHYIRAKEAGVKFITVDPIYTASAQMLDAEWIPIRTGTDIIAMILSKYTSLEIGKALLVSDFCIALFAGGLYGVRTGLYCVLGLLAKAFVVDGVIEGINVRKKVTIVSRQPDKINEFIMGTLHRGATVYTAHGAFSGRDEQVITTVLNRREAVSLRNYIRRTDPGAFITIVNSSETIGKGFRAI